MLDIRTLRADPSAVTTLLARRGDPGLADAVEQAVRLDAERREILAGVEVLKAERNEVSRRIGDLKRTGDSTHELVASMQTVAEQIRTLDGLLEQIEAM